VIRPRPHAGPFYIFIMKISLVEVNQAILAWSFFLVFTAPLPHSWFSALQN
jgi:hypothetical protein